MSPAMREMRLIHPALPRVSQGITAALAILAIALGSPLPLAIALVLVLLALAGPRFSPVAWVFRRVARPAAELEPAAPVRFSQWLAVLFLSTAIALTLLGLDIAAWIVAGGVAAVALLSAATGLCIGCEVYRVALALRRGDGEDVRDALGLDGAGPWLVVLTAPGCARCGPVAKAVEHAAAGRAVVRVDLRERPQAAVVPVKSVPALVVVDGDGRVREARAGALERAEIADVLGRLPDPVPA